MIKTKVSKCKYCGYFNNGSVTAKKFHDGNLCIADNLKHQKETVNMLGL